MKKVLKYILLGIGLTILGLSAGNGFINLFVVPILTMDRVEQVVMDKSLGTFVWYNGDIVYSKFDDINTLTDSIKELRYNEAARIKNTLDK